MKESKKNQNEPSPPNYTLSAKSTAILLAAGESSRMGQLKAVLPWHGSPMLDHQINSLFDGGIDEIIVVLGHQKDLLLPMLHHYKSVIPIYNRDYLSGKATSIKSGLSKINKLNTGCILLLNVDQPRSSATIQTLLQKHLSSQALITIPSFNGKGGHPIIFDISLLENLLEIEEASQGVKSVVSENQSKLQKVPLDSEEVLWDLNTPDEYLYASDKSGQYPH